MSTNPSKIKNHKTLFVGGGVLFFVLTGISLIAYKNTHTVYDSSSSKTTLIESETTSATPPQPVAPVLDVPAYDAKMLALANNPPPPEPQQKVITNADGTKTTVTVQPKIVTPLWPCIRMPEHYSRSIALSHTTATFIQRAWVYSVSIRLM